MYQRILIATDGSDLSRMAVDSGIELAALAGAQVVALKVIPRYPVSYFEGSKSLSANNQDIAATEKQWADAALAVVEEVKASAEAKGVKAKAITKTSDLIAGPSSPWPKNTTVI